MRSHTIDDHRQRRLLLWVSFSLGLAIQDVWLSAHGGGTAPKWPTRAETLAFGLSAISGVVALKSLVPATDRAGAKTLEAATAGLGFSQGEFPEGSRYAFFVGALVINDQWDEDFSVLYAHDLAADLPVGPWSRFRSDTGRQTVDVLACLVTAFGTSGDWSGLEALIEASLESDVLEGSDKGTLRRCALGCTARCLPLQKASSSSPAGECGTPATQVPLLR